MEKLGHDELSYKWISGFQYKTLGLIGRYYL